MFVLTHVSPVLFWPLFWQKQPPLCLPLRFGWHHYLTHTHTLSRVSSQNSVPYFALIMWREPKSGLNFREWKNRNLLLYGNLHNGERLSLCKLFAVKSSYLRKQSKTNDQQTDKKTRGRERGYRWGDGKSIVLAVFPGRGVDQNKESATPFPLSVEWAGLITVKALFISICPASFSPFIQFLFSGETIIFP